MSKEHLTEGTVRAVAALHARGFVVCRAATNEAFFTPRFVSHALRSNCSSLPVELDYSSAHRRSTALTRHLRRTAMRLPDFSGRLGDARDQRHYSLQTLDNVLQAIGARQPEDAAFSSCFVRGGRASVADGNSQSSDRRHTDSAPIRNSARQHDSARSRQEGQSDAVCTGAMLGDLGHQCLGWSGTQICTAHRVTSSAGQRQSQQAHHRVVSGARTDSGDEGPAGANSIRRLVHASATGIAAAITKDASHRSGTARHSAILAARGVAQTGARTTQKIRCKNDTRCDSGFAGNRSKTDVVWQGTVGSSAFSVGDGALSQRRTGARRVVLVLRSRQTELDKSALAVGERNRIECRRNLATVRTTLGHRTVVSQPETLVGREQSVAAETHRTGTVDADSFNGVDAGSAIEFGRGRVLPDQRCGTVARQATADRRSSSTMATNGIYRTCFQGWIQSEVRDIHLPGTARRPKIADVALLSATDSKRFNQFSINCATDPVTQG